MQRPIIKVLIFSIDNDFLSSHGDEIKKSFVVQRAPSRDIFQFMLKEWEPDFFLIDSKYLTPQELIHISQQPKQTTIVFYDNNNLRHEEAYVRAGADYFLNLQISPSCLFNRLSNHYNKWVATSLRAVPDQIHEIERTNSYLEKEFSDPSRYLMFDNLKVYPEEYLIKMDDEVVSTSPIQFKLLLSFIKNHDQLLTRKWLQEYVWSGAEISPRSIDAQISKLKKTVPLIDTYLINVYGKGYILSSTKKQVA